MKPRAAIAALWAVVVLPGLALRELMPPDEPRFALVARQMREAGRSRSPCPRMSLRVI